MSKSTHLTKAYIHLDRMSHNLRLLQELAPQQPIWPAIKANAYGHGIEIVARHLVGLGYNTLCVAHISEVATLVDDAAINAKYLLLSPTLPEHSQAIVNYDCEPGVCTVEFLEALAKDALRLGRCIGVHLMVDTGMGRVGISPQDVPEFLRQCQRYSSIQVRGLMSHFACADKADKTLSEAQIERFQRLSASLKSYSIEVRHMANSAAIFDLPHAHFDAVRPGIAIYGLLPSDEMLNPQVAQLQPVLEWKTRITFLKEVSKGTGLSYGHTFYTQQESLIATVPVGYGDGLSRNLSNNMDFLIRGVRCPQVGIITMDQCLIDVSALRGQVALDDEVVIIGCQGNAQITADELAQKLGTINYEIVTAISDRVPRVVVRS